jgi:hypothetical protein
MMTEKRKFFVNDILLYKSPVTGEEQKVSMRGLVSLDPEVLHVVPMGKGIPFDAPLSALSLHPDQRREEIDKKYDDLQYTLECIEGLSDADEDEMAQAEEIKKELWDLAEEKRNLLKETE